MEHTRHVTVSQAKRLVVDFHRSALGSSPGRVEFVADKAPSDQNLSEYFGFPYQFSFRRLIHTRLHNVADTTDQSEV
jgi:hypothetical protein